MLKKTLYTTLFILLGLPASALYAANMDDDYSQEASSSYSSMADDAKRGTKRSRENGDSRAAKARPQKDDFAIVHLQANDGSTVTMPRQAFDLLFPLLQQQKLTTPSETIALDLTGAQIEDLAQLAMQYSTLQETITETDPVKKRLAVINALAHLPLGTVPTQVSAVSLENLKANISPEMASALKIIDIQKLLAALPFKVEMDTKKVDQSFMNMIITLNEHGAHKDIIQAVGRQWKNYIENTSNTPAQRNARLQFEGIENPMLKQVLSDAINPPVSIAELIAQGAIPVSRRNELDLSNKKIDSLDGLMAIPGIQNIRLLNLGENRISNIKNAFDNLLQLRELYLYNNQINSLKDAFDHLPQLEILALDNNQISNIQGAFNNLTQLQKLGLEENEISNIQGAFNHLPQLQWLSLTNNQIANIQDAFDHLPQLQELDLDDNQISNIQGAFNNLTQLQKLNLGNNQINNIQGAFNNLTQLQILGLFNNQISNIQGAFDTLTQLQTLWIFGNQLTSAQEDELRTILPNANIIFTEPQEQ